jgi:hypothetical protein
MLLGGEEAEGGLARSLGEENLALHHKMDEVTQAFFFLC